MLAGCIAICQQALEVFTLTLLLMSFVLASNAIAVSYTHLKKEAKKKTVTKSITDPDSGMFVKGEHERQLAYEAHTACDEHGYVLETVVTPGNIHDSVAFDDVYDKVTERFPEIATVAVSYTHLQFRYMYPYPIQHPLSRRAFEAFLPSVDDPS